MNVQPPDGPWRKLQRDLVALEVLIAPLAPDHAVLLVHTPHLQFRMSTVHF